jgi:hypothetical protein
MEKLWAASQCIAQYPEDDSVNATLNLLNLATHFRTFTTGFCLGNSLTSMTRPPFGSDCPADDLRRWILFPGVRVEMRDQLERVAETDAVATLFHLLSAM